VDDSLSVQVQRKSDGKVIESRIKSKKDAKDVVYEFWGSIGDVVEIVPKSAQQLLFPAKREFRVEEAKTCPLRVEDFQAKMGSFLSGRVEPAIAGVKISVLDKNTAERIAQVETTADGAFRVGPLHEDRDYQMVLPFLHSSPSLCTSSLLCCTASLALLCFSEFANSEIISLFFGVAFFECRKLKKKATFS
jgi:hypothetical protein